MTNAVYVTKRMNEIPANVDSLENWTDIFIQWLFLFHVLQLKEG